MDSLSAMSLEDISRKEKDLESAGQVNIWWNSYFWYHYYQFERFIIKVSCLKFTLEIADTNGDNNARSFVITNKMVAIKRYERLEHVEEYVPCVVEPSFGIGRIMYALFEHR